MSYVAIMSYDSDNRVSKYQDGFSTQTKAQAHVDKFSGAFVAENPGGNPLDWLVDVAAGTISISKRVEAKPTVISYKDFQDRFTAAEFDAATEFVYETETTTGKPKHKTLIQGLARAVASNRVDLNDPKTAGFLDALVNADPQIITEARKTEIITP